ncbi:MAG: DUF3368 domain-containing protein [Eubacteriales bacterium]|nr:DUF3368 domain-containing protein [Eubacteriales bacterium]
MRRVIVNSTPLIVLCKIGRLDILKNLYGEIIIPQAVFSEVTAKKDSVCRQIREKEWIHVEQITDQSDKKMYRAKLHDGEVEVMILAQGMPKADLVVIDDNAAKKTAKYLGLTVTGTIGVLLRAKEAGIIENVSPVIKEMKQRGFYISAELERIVLKQANEFL